MPAVLAGTSQILACAAHPDDLEYYAGGTLDLCARRGAAVWAVIATDGARGGTGARLGVVRRAEQEQAARILGYRQVIFLGFPDRELPEHLAALVAKVTALLLEMHPDTVLTFDGQAPRRPYIHRDHQAIASAVWSACLRLPAPPRLLLFSSRRPNVAVDIDLAFGRKIMALRAHRSQSAGAQLPRLLRPVWRLAGRRTGFPLVLRRELFRLAEPPLPEDTGTRRERSRSHLRV